MNISMMAFAFSFAAVVMATLIWFAFWLLPQHALFDPKILIIVIGIATPIFAVSAGILLLFSIWLSRNPR